jgi:NitT/TauT family transport system substrate-binding protein
MNIAKSVFCAGTSVSGGDIANSKKIDIWNYGSIVNCQPTRKLESIQRSDSLWFRNTAIEFTGAIDATLAMSYNEYYQLVQSGFIPTKDNVYRFCDHGYNVQEDGVYMARDYYLKHREQARRFAAASKKGWEWAAAHPEETLDIVMRYVQKEHIATNRVLQQLMLKDILRLQVDRESKKREFRLRPDMVKQASKLMIEHMMLSREISYQEIIAK